MKTHFCYIERGHEGDPMTYYSDTACGLSECESEMSDDVKDVSCKNCLRVLNRKNPPRMRSKIIVPNDVSIF